VKPKDVTNMENGEWDNHRDRKGCGSVRARARIYIYIYIYARTRVYIYIKSHTHKCVSTAGTRWRSWLRHCATSRRVTSSIPDGVIGIFH